MEVYLSKYFEVINNHTQQQLVDLVYFEYKVRPKPKWKKPGNDLCFFHMDNTTYIPRQHCSFVPACLLEHHTHRIRIFLRPANFAWYLIFECESKRGHPLLLAYLFTQVLTTRTFLYRTFWKTHWIDGISIRLHTGVIVLTGNRRALVTDASLAVNYIYCNIRSLRHAFRVNISSGRFPQGK